MKPSVEQPDRLAAVARAIREELFYEKYHCMPLRAGAPEGAHHLALARAAILAADGHDDALAAIRIERESQLRLWAEAE